MNRRPLLLLLLSGLQHPGGAHTRGKDGINTVGRRMINGQTRGDRQHRLVSRKSRSQLQESEVARLLKRPTRRCCRQETHSEIFFSCVSRPVTRNSLHAPLLVHRNTFPDAHTRTFFSCEHRSASSAHLQCGHTTLAQGEIESASLRVFHIHLIP